MSREGEREEQMESNKEQKTGHLARLGESEWGMWRWVGLRAAGFGIEGVLRLSAEEAAAAADRVMEAEDEVESLWQAALDNLRRILDEASSDDRPLLIKALRVLKKGKVPDLTGAEPSVDAAIRHFASAFQEADHAYKEFNLSFEASTMRVSEAICEIARTSKFREAVIWQNRRGFHTAISLLLQGPPKQSQKNQHWRRSEELAAIYLQRYCTKNDTIGFFGPIGWARVKDKESLIHVEPGPNLVADRNVYFDAWAIDAVAEALGKNDAIRPWLAPRRAPSIFIEGDLVHLPLKAPLPITRAEAAALHLCDGELTAIDIARRLIDDQTISARDEAEAYRLLEELQSRGLIYWKLEIAWNAQSPFDWHVENNLRKILENIGDDALKEQALAPLDRLEKGRDEIARAAGDAEKLDRAFNDLESEFTGITGLPATRADGRMYAGRTIVYEDCRRDVNVELGSRLIESLSQPLSLILASARWYIGEIAEVCLKAFEEIYAELKHETGSSAVSFQEFWTRAQPLVFGDKRGLLARCLSNVQERWLEILSFDPEASSVEHASDQLRQKVLAAFPAPKRGWSYARYNSPDVMISASSVEAIQRGDYRFVMGEFHVGTNTLNGMFFAAQHPSPQDLFSYFEADMPEPLIIPVAPKFMITQRTYSVFESPKDYRLEFASDPSGVSGDRLVPIGSLVIEKESSGLLVRSRDGEKRFGILEPFGDMLSEKVANHFKLLPPLDHTPRIAIDRLVIARETWQLPASEMDFAFEKDEPQRFLAARRWARLNGLPRFVFFKSPVEVKPCYLDFDSPILVNIFSKIIRRTIENAPSDGGVGKHKLITVSEMLPTPDQVWLPDGEGNRYTGEFRIVSAFQPQ